MTAPLPPGHTRPAASSQPVDTDGIDWGVHRGSCRIFYAERRCTCGVIGKQDGKRDEQAHNRGADRYVPPKYPVDEPPTWRATCSCGWVGQERYGQHVAGGVDLPGRDHDNHTATQAPSAGQDTERLRDEIARVLASGESVTELEHLYADALLDGPLRQLIAERDEARQERDVIAAGVQAVKGQRDEARAQVQRVRDLIAPWPKDELTLTVRRALDSSC